MMNERIKELAEKAGFHFDEHNEPTQRKVELLVELLTREYEQFLPEMCPWEEGPMKGWHVAFVARKHFGIE